MGRLGALRGLALGLLEAIDAGTPAGPLARELAVEALRVSSPDAASWALAVGVLEGGPLRVRRAVELAGLVLDACDAAGAVGTAAG